MGTWACPNCGRLNQYYSYPTRCSRCGYLHTPGAVLPAVGEVGPEVTKGKEIFLEDTLERLPGETVEEFLARKIFASYEPGGRFGPKVKPPPPVTPEVTYDKSLEEFRKASREFRLIREAYRAKKIGDEEFLRGKANFDKASEVADEAETAYIKAKAIPKAEVTPRPTSRQAAATAQRLAREREAQVFKETEAKFTEEAASTETITEREARRKVTPPAVEAEDLPMSVIEYDLRYTLKELREMARQEGLSASGSKKEIAAGLIAMRRKG